MSFLRLLNNLMNMEITKIYIALLLIVTVVIIFGGGTYLYTNKPKIGTAIGVYIPFDSKAMNEAIKYCDSKPEKCNTLLNLSLTLDPLSSYKSIKNLIPEGGQKQTEMRIVIDNEIYDMSWEEFKNRISQKR